MRRTGLRITAPLLSIGLFGVLITGQMPAAGASQAVSSFTLTDPGTLPTTDKTYHYNNSLSSAPLQVGQFLDMAKISLAVDGTQHLLRIDFVANKPITPAVCRPPKANVQWNISDAGCVLQVRLWAVDPATGATPSHPGTNEYDFILIPYARPTAQVSQVGNSTGSVFVQPQIVRQQIWGNHFNTWISTRHFPNHRIHMDNPIASSNRWIDAKHDEIGVEDTVVGATGLPDLWVSP